MSNPLLDKDFLKQLDQLNDRIVYAKIISLDLNENPIEEISGKTTQGSVSIDGSSAVRRTCSLTLTTDDINVTNYYWGLCTKFKLFIGLKIPEYLKNKSELVTYETYTTRGVLEQLTETVYPYKDYPDIIWFPLGIYLVTSFTINFGNSSAAISITGKDKMCLLNGDIGGNLVAQNNFGETDYYDEDYNKTTKTNTLKSIIREMIHYYGGEPFHNIIINDLDTTGVELLDFKGDELYLFKNVESGLFENAIIDGSVPRYNEVGDLVYIDNSLNNIIYEKLNSQLVDSSNTEEATKVRSTKSKYDDNFYTVIKCEYGQAVGYRSTELTYAGDLIANAGDTVTSVLDKITKMLGDYEYFYDLDGHFVFQKKLTYVNTSWNNITPVDDDEDYVESAKTVSLISYNFTDSTLITSFTNNPNFTNIKNDYTIWGQKGSSENSTIHYRCAIDEKPDSYTQITVSEADVLAWRNAEANFFEDMTEDGISNYVQTDPKTFSTADYDWREIIYQMAEDYLKYNHLDDFELRVAKANPQYITGKTGYEQYYTDLDGFWRLLYNPTGEEVALADIEDYEYYTKDDGELAYWNKLVDTDPSSLLFWFDFLNANGTALSKYAVPAIGDRPKVVNDTSAKAIYYGEIPEIVYITTEEYEKLEEADLINDEYTYIFLPESLEEYFTISTKSKSCKDEIDTLVYENAYINESITINAIPIYYLLPNTKISVYDAKSNINGEFIINKITLPLTYNGTMSISATKAPIRLY